MGSGCEVAKDAADMIITDDNFSSTMNAMMWGRNMFDNVRKFLVFQMTVNIACCVIVVISSLTLGESYLSVIHLLWANMVMDTLAAIALATEPPHPTQLRTRPVRVYDRILSPVMWRQILGVSIYQLVMLLIVLYLAPVMFDYDYPFYVKPLADLPEGSE